MATKSQLRIKKIAKISTVVLGLGLLLTMANVGDSILVSAQPNDKAETEVRLAANKPDSVFETQVDGEKLIINKQIGGDLYCAGGDVEIQGTVKGDLICGAANLTINAHVEGDVRSAGNSVKLGDKAVINGNVSLGANSVTIDKDAKLNSELHAFAWSVTSHGQVVGNSYLFAAQTHLYGSHGGNVEVQTSDLIVGGDSEIDGELAYSAARSDVHTNAKIKSRRTVERTSMQPEKTFVGNLVATILLFLSIMLAGGLMLAIRKQTIDRITQDFSLANAVKAVFYGLGLLIASVLVMVMTLIMPITWMVGLAIGLSVGLMSLFSLPVIAYYFGRLIITKLLNRTGHFMAKLAAGAGALMVISLIPVVGGIVMFLAFFMGLGKILIYLIDEVFTNQDGPIEAAEISRASASPRQIAKKLEEAESENKENQV